MGCFCPLVAISVYYNQVRHHFALHPLLNLVGRKVKTESAQKLFPKKKKDAGQKLKPSQCLSNLLGQGQRENNNESLGDFIMLKGSPTLRKVTLEFPL